MLIDLSLPVTTEMINKASDKEPLVAQGHLGTHFDVCGMDFPIEFAIRKGIVFDVRGKKMISAEDIDTGLIEKDTFVAFNTGFIDIAEYGSDTYFSEHPQLSLDLINLLLDRGISIIGIDFAGIRTGDEHTPMDRRCAGRGVFVVENLCNLDKVLNGRKNVSFQALVFPVNYVGMSGLPCRVVASVEGNSI